MTFEINETHDPNLKSWIESANAPDTDFPIQNLPFCLYRRIETRGNARTGVVIGDRVFNLALGYEAGLFDDKGFSMVVNADHAWNFNEIFDISNLEDIPEFRQRLQEIFKRFGIC